MFPKWSINFKSLSDNLFPTPGISIKSRPEQEFIFIFLPLELFDTNDAFMVKRDVYTNSVPLINNIAHKKYFVAICYESLSCNLITDVTGIIVNWSG